MATSDQPTADDLPRGTTLTDTYSGDTLTITERGNGEITWEEDDGYSETHTVEAVQNSLNDGYVEVENIPDDDHGTMTIVDADPDDYSDTNLYIRFGDTPDDERSYDNRNDRLEDGVSVYACEHDTDDYGRTVYYLKGSMIQTALLLMTRDTYLVTGEHVGTGADGEPLLRDVKAVAELGSPEGVGGFILKD